MHNKYSGTHITIALIDSKGDYLKVVSEQQPPIKLSPKSPAQGVRKLASLINEPDSGQSLFQDGRQCATSSFAMIHPMWSQLVKYIP